MKIGLIGAGMMAEMLAGRWVEAGHEVFVGARSPERAEALAGKIGAAHRGTLREAAEFGEAVLFAVKKVGFREAIVAAGGPEGALAGKTLIDCGNAVDTATWSLTTYDGLSMAEEIARLAPGAYVIKAFNLGHGNIWRNAAALSYAGRPLAVPMAGHEDGKATARQLIEDLGCAAQDFGDLSQTGFLEAAGVMVVRQLFIGGADPLSTLLFTTADAPVPAPAG